MFCDEPKIAKVPFPVKGKVNFFLIFEAVLALTSHNRRNAELRKFQQCLELAF